MNRKEYDFKKAKALIEERIESLQSAALGMHEDCFWTAEDVYRDGKWLHNLDEIKEVAGINGSDWATPTLNLNYKDGSEDMIEVSVGDQDISLGEKIQQQINWTSGVISSEVQANISPLKQIDK